jgi:hypothetical protein
MSLESFIAEVNSLAFWKEFTFAQNRFSPTPRRELELADNIVWLEDFALIIQLKERTEPSGDPDTERRWFRNKIQKKAKDQIRDTLTYLSDHPDISITNERGHVFQIRGQSLTEIVRVIVYFADDALPDDCREVQFIDSQGAGFVHVLEANDYLEVLRVLRVPGDIREYFGYRQDALSRLKTSGEWLLEADILGGYTHDEAHPRAGSSVYLQTLIQDLDSFLLTGLIGNMHKNIESAHGVTDHYRIMLEFGKVPRSVWRGIKGLLQYGVKTVKAERFGSPVRAFFPKTDCVFMILPLDPQLWGGGEAEKARRANGLQTFTYIAKYIHRARRAVGIQISRDGADYLIDWALHDEQWQPDPELEARLSKFNPFQPAKDRMADSFLFLEE